MDNFWQRLMKAVRGISGDDFASDLRPDPRKEIVRDLQIRSLTKYARDLISRYPGLDVKIDPQSMRAEIAHRALDQTALESLKKFLNIDLSAMSRNLAEVCRSDVSPHFPDGHQFVIDDTPVIALADDVFIAEARTDLMVAIDGRFLRRMGEFLEVVVAVAHLPKLPGFSTQRDILFKNLLALLRSLGPNGGPLPEEAYQRLIIELRALAPPSQIATFGRVLKHRVVTFILAHEFAHMLKHILVRPTSSNSRMPDTPGSPPQRALDELEADRIAASVVINALLTAQKGDPDTASGWLISVALYCIAISAEAAPRPLGPPFGVFERLHHDDYPDSLGRLTSLLGCFFPDQPIFAADFVFCQFLLALFEFHAYAASHPADIPGGG
jgi:hypothetical protein